MICAAVWQPHIGSGDGFGRDHQPQWFGRDHRPYSRSSFVSISHYRVAKGLLIVIPILIVLLVGWVIGVVFVIVFIIIVLFLFLLDSSPLDLSINLFVVELAFVLLIVVVIAFALFVLPLLYIRFL